MEVNSPHVHNNNISLPIPMTQIAVPKLKYKEYPDNT
jgi:phage pi2 protein 07